MKSNFSRSLFAAFLIIAGYVGSFAQTTVTLPTIPCSNCNGPGAFATSAPACTSGLVGAPLTMSWGAASGATSYTIMIATDAALSQNVATHTTTGTSLSIPAIGLAPSTTYYWTVFANSATGSTKATGSTCTFSTNTTWTASSATGGFPNGTLSQQRISNGVAGGYYTCQSGDGTCASGDNLVCNPQFQQVNANTSPFVPDWELSPSQTSTITGSGGYNATPYVLTGVNLAGSGASIPSSGTQTGAQYQINGVGGYWISAGQPLYINNTTTAPMTYQFTIWARYGGGTSAVAMHWGLRANGVVVGTSPDPAVTSTIDLSNSWTQYTRTMTVAAGASVTYLGMIASEAGSTSPLKLWMTDVRLCKL